MNERTESNKKQVEKIKIVIIFIVCSIERYDVGCLIESFFRFSQEHI